VLSPIGSKQVKPGELLQFTVSAFDPDGDSLAYSVSNLPAGASFNPATRIFSWTPQTSGVYSGIRFSVSDGELSDYEVITISVTETGTGQTVEVVLSVATGADDGFSGDWGFHNSLTWYEAGNMGAPYNAWFRFTGINIPKGAVIEAAHLEITESQWGNGTKLSIAAEKEANPAAPSSTANHNQKVRTQAKVAWDTGYSDWAYHNTPDLTAVVQELVTSYAYTDGSILILVDNSGSVLGSELVGNTFEAGKPARLFIRYR
jgi:hypothetical protein